MLKRQWAISDRGLDVLGCGRGPRQSNGYLQHRSTGKQKAEILLLRVLGVCVIFSTGERQKKTERERGSKSLKLWKQKFSRLGPRHERRKNKQLSRESQLMLFGRRTSGSLMCLLLATAGRRDEVMYSEWEVTSPHTLINLNTSQWWDATDTVDRRADTGLRVHCDW